MHGDTIESYSHDHAFLGTAHESNERRTMLVVALTATMMVVEIGAGSIFGSMALVADGWHMSTHVAALGIAALAYRYARTHRHDARFSFGTGKLGELAGFASAIILAMIALYIGYESVTRLLAPVPIAFAEAIPIAVLGLGVNLSSAWLLHGGEGHADDRHRDANVPHALFHEFGDHHAHDHTSRAHSHRHHHHGSSGDTNFRAAYVHVLADALTSVLAIVALTAGRFLGWTWLDPVMGLAGTVVIAAWAVTLIRSAGSILLDMMPSRALAERVRAAIEVDGDRVVDLHLWRLGPGHIGAILSLVAAQPQDPAIYKARLSAVSGMSHTTIEVNRCKQGHAKPAEAA